MDSRIDLTANRDFSNNRRLQIRNIDISSILEKILESNKGYKKIIFKNNKLNIVDSKELYDDYYENKCERCGRKIMRYGLCDRCDNEFMYDICYDEIFKKKELVSLL